MTTATVRIVGSGVAAALAALALVGSGRVVRIERRPLARRSGFVMTASAGFATGLCALGVGDAWRTWRGWRPLRRHHAAWGGPEFADTASLRPDGPVALLERTALEAWLWREVERQGLVTDDAPATEGDFEVDATGRAAAVARRRRAGLRRGPPLIAISGDLATQALRVDETAVQSGPAGWWYGARTETAASLMYVTYPRRGAAGRATAWREEAPGFGPLHGARAADAARTAFAASSSWLEDPCGCDWAAVGDAALAHDPLSGHGLEAAVESALLLRDCLATGPFAADRYRAGMLDRVARYRVERHRTYRAGASPAQTAFWQAHSRI